MTTIKRFASASALALLFLFFSTQAQTPQVSTVNVTPDERKVRVAAVGDVLDMRVAVSDESGDVVFESGAVADNKLDWTMRDPQGQRVPAGSYTMTVTYRTSTGKLRRRVEQIFVTEEMTRETKQEGPTPTAVGTITGQGTTGRISKFTGTNAIGNSVMFESAGRIGIGTAAPQQSLHAVGPSSRLRLQSTNGIALTTTEYVTNGRVWQAGAGGSTAAGGVANKFFVYDQTANQYRLVVDTAGNFGIGTTAPTSKLTVNGGIQIVGAGNGIKFADGSIQTKAIAGTINGTGAANRIAKFTGPNSFGNSSITEVSGNVGIGTAAPKAKLHLVGGDLLAGASGEEWIFHTRSQAGGDFLHITDSDGGTPQFQRGLVLTQAGNVGIGTTNPQRALQIGPDTNALFTISPSDSSTRAGFIRFGDGTGWSLIIGRSREGSGGPLNTGFSGNLIAIRDDGALFQSGGYPFGATGTGPLCRTLSNAITLCQSSSSSLRYKTNVSPYVSGLGLVRRLRPITFTRKDTGLLGVGLAAEEVKEAEPLLTFDNERGEAEGVRYELVGVALINAIKEQQNLIEQQARQNEEQRLLIEQLQARLARIERTMRKKRTASGR